MHIWTEALVPRLSLYLLGESDGAEAAELQHGLQLLSSSGDQRDGPLLRSLLHLPQANDELRLCGKNQTCRTERRRASVTHIHRSVWGLNPGEIT